MTTRSQIIYMLQNIINAGGCAINPSTGRCVNSPYNDPEYCYKKKSSRRCNIKKKNRSSRIAKHSISDRKIRGAQKRREFEGIPLEYPPDSPSDPPSRTEFESSTQSEGPELVESSTQSEGPELVESSTQSEGPELVESSTQSEGPELVESSTQSEGPELVESSTQSEGPELVESSTQSEGPELVESSTQSEGPELVESEVPPTTCFCTNPITDENIWQCSQCSVFAHKTCIDDWAQINNTCPYCKKEIEGTPYVNPQQTLSSSISTATITDDIAAISGMITSIILLQIFPYSSSNYTQINSNLFYTLIIIMKQTNWYLSIQKPDGQKAYYKLNLSDFQTAVTNVSNITEIPHDTGFTEITLSDWNHFNTPPVNELTSIFSNRSDDSTNMNYLQTQIYEAFEDANMINSSGALHITGGYNSSKLLLLLIQKYCA